MTRIHGMPRLVVTVAGRRMPAADLARITSVTVGTALGRPAQCLVEAVAADHPAGEPSVGDSLRIDVEGRGPALFTGEITVVEYGYRADSQREIRVRGYDALHRLRKRQALRDHGETDLAELATTLAAGSGLSIDAPAVALGHVFQGGRSDLDLLLDMSARVGRWPVVDDETLRLVDLAGEGEPVPLEYGTNVHSVHVEVSQEPAFRQVTASSWDPVTAEGRVETAADSRAGAEVGADPTPDRVGGGGAMLRMDDVGSHTPASLAQAELDTRSSAEVTAELVTDGDPALRPGRRIDLRSVAPALEGVYVLTEVTHRLDGSGYASSMTTRPPAGPPPRPPDQVTLGIVDDVQDPQDRGRVRATLATYPGLVTPWVPVLVAAAGPEKGLVVLPDAGDTVLVLLPAGDPAAAVVLGGLYGVTTAADPGGHRGTRMSVRTADGQQIRLDGGARSVVLTDGHGSSVELGPDLLRITAATDLLLEAPGRAMRVRARTVDFEEAT